MRATNAAVAVIFSLGLASNAQALTIGNMTLVGGYYSHIHSVVSGDLDLGGYLASFLSSAAIISNGVGFAQTPTWDCSIGCAAGAILYLNNTSAQIGGNYAAPSGTFEYGGAINVDLSSLFVNWYGVDFHEGKMVSGTVDSGGQFTLNWTSDTDWEIDNPAHTYGGSSWTWVGQVSELNTVPVPAALWLFGSGLAGLMAVARRRISA